MQVDAFDFVELKKCFVSPKRISIVMALIYL